MKEKMRKNPLKRKSKQIQHEKPVRITNETVAEHRERILAGGRKFKYPHQYVRHKLVINAILISLAVLVVAVVIGWFQLYKAQNTSEFMYRVTRVLPVAIASVDGEQVRYSDYLMRYRSHELYLRNTGQIGLNASDDKKQLDFFKRSVLSGLEKDVYAEKIARERGVSVTDADVDMVIDSGRNTATGKVSKEVYDASTQDTLGYSPDEYRHIIRQSLLRHKVAYKVDDNAHATQERVGSVVKKVGQGQSLEKLVANLKKQGRVVDYGGAEQVSRNNRDGGLTIATLSMKIGEISSVVQSTTGDGYYFLRRLPAESSKVSYEYIRIPLTEFDGMFDALKKQKKINEYVLI
jgi:hypothetical protein